MNSWIRELRSRRRDIRKALERVPVLGPAVISAFRRGRQSWRERQEEKPERFLALYKQRNNIDDFSRITDSVKRLHVDFALTTVPRGRRAAERVQCFVDVRRKSYLDVGCAYGGFLVAFAEAGASRVVGIDVNPQLLDYARELLADYQVPAEVRQIDVLAADRSPELGTFDIITCNDVIEHVLDPRAALARLAALLADDGVLYMEIPNRWSSSFVLSDGHHRMYGITSLPKKQADQYFADARSQRHPGHEQSAIQHDVTYASLPFYMNHLARLGLAVRLIGSTPADPPAYLEKVSRTFDETEARLKSDLPGVTQEIRRSLEVHVLRVARAFRRGHERYRSLQASDREAAKAFGDKLFLMFGCDFWTLLIEKRRGARVRTVSWAKELG